MSGYGKLQTLEICLCELLASKTHNIFNLRNKITKKNVVLLIFIFLHGKNLHHLILLRIWHKTFQVIGCGRLYLNWRHTLRPNARPCYVGWGETTRTLISWRQGYCHPTRNECMGWYAQIMLCQHLPLLFLLSEQNPFNVYVLSNH